LSLVAQVFPLALRRWFFQQLVLVFDFYHRLGLKNREVRPCMCRCDAHSGMHIRQLAMLDSLDPAVHGGEMHAECLLTIQLWVCVLFAPRHHTPPQVRLHNLMLASDSPRSALKMSDFEYSKTEQVRAMQIVCWAPVGNEECGSQIVPASQPDTRCIHTARCTAWHDHGAFCYVPSLSTLV